MKITFIYLPRPYLKQPDSQAPIGILYLKSILDSHGYMGVHCEVKNYSSYTNEDAINDLSKSDIYGITVTSLELPLANEFSKLIKQKYPNSKIILGGAGIDQSLAFIDYVDYNYISSCFIGEAENGIFDVINDYLDHGELQLYYRGSPLRELDLIPFPDRKCLGNEQGGNIFAFNKKYKGSQSTVILTSRGCPFSCAFCASPKYENVKSVRFRSPKNVYEEIKQVKEELDIHQFRFSDDMFTARPFDQFKQLCDYLKELDIAFRVSCRVKPFDHKIAKILIDSGCREVSFGVESFDDHVLKVLNKKTTAEENYRAIEIAKDSGLMVRALMMIRTPGQTKETIDINIRYLKKSNFDICTCSSFVPLPGSDIWDNPDTYNIEILTKDLSKYNFFFYGKDGENELYDIIKLKDRSLKEFNDETLRFKEFMRSTKKLNMG